MSFALISPAVDIAIFSVALSLLSLFINMRFFKFRERMQSQKDMRGRQKELAGLLKTQDEASKKKAEAIQKEMMESMAGQMKDMPKQMIVMAIVFLPPLYAIGYLYTPAGYFIHTGMDIPLLGAQWGWLKTYIVYSLIAGIAFQVAASKIFAKKKEE